MTDYQPDQLETTPTATSTPAPGTMKAAVKPAKPAPKKRASRGGGRPRKAASSTARPSTKSAAEKLADAATAGLSNETKTGRPSTASKMEQGLVNLHVGLGAMCSVGGLMMQQPRMVAVGGALEVQADACAKALASWADSSPRVRAALESFTEYGGGLLVLAAYAPIVQAAITGKAPEGATDPLEAIFGAMDLGAMMGNGANPAG